MEARSGQPDRDHHFLHTNVFLRHASGNSGEAEHYIETILTQAAVAKRRVWVSSILFAQLRPSMFVPGRFDTLDDFARYIRSLATLVTPDPNTMLRVARLRDARWQRSAEAGEAEEKPRTLSFGDAIEIASALWVKEAGGVTDLKFLMFDDWSPTDARGGGPPLAVASPGLCAGCAGQFRRDGGGAADAHRASTPGELDSAICAGGVRLTPSAQLAGAAGRQPGSTLPLRQCRRPRCA
jgi:hypothetical protein